MKKKIFWAIVTLFLSLFTVWVLLNNSGLSLTELWQNITSSSPIWLLAAAICMLGFIFFEGSSIVLIVRALGFPAKKRRGFLYASADIYFSSITPSATGGQPASAYFMHKDGISTVAVTVSLLLNLTMYTLAIITLGLFSIIFFPKIFLEFNLSSKLMILTGVFVMFLLTAFFIILLKKQSILFKFMNLIISIMDKIHLNAAANKIKQKLDTAIENYNECVITLAGKKSLLVKTFLLNFLQRTSQILVTVFCYFAMHGKLADGLKLFAIQTYVVLGSNFIPIPGAVGISEFIMYFGYRMLLNEENAYKLAILSRGITFYTCGIISLITVISGYILIRIKNYKLNKKTRTEYPYKKQA